MMFTGTQLLVLAGGLIIAPAQSVAPTQQQQMLRQVDITPRLNQTLPQELTFRDERGRGVELGSLVGQRPVILTLVYYECPMLCNLLLESLVDAMRELSFDVGEEFDIVTLSIDPRETSVLAAAKKRAYLSHYDRAGAAHGWHFLTGEEPHIAALAEAVGFHYRYDAETDQYAHAAGIMVVTAEGRLSHYLLGLNFTTTDLRLALVEASRNTIGTWRDQALLLCYHYDPTTGRYGFMIMNIVRIGGVLTVIGLVVMVLRLNHRRAVGSSPASPARAPQR